MVCGGLCGFVNDVRTLKTSECGGVPSPYHQRMTRPGLEKEGVSRARRAGGSRADRVPDLDRCPAYRLTHAQAAGLLGVSTARVAELVG